MTVVTQQVVQFRRFSGYIDPRYPEGSWFVRFSSQGDVTGGVTAADIIFAFASAPALSSRMFSLEQFSIDINDAISRTVGLKTTNMTGSITAGLQHRYSIQLRVDVDTGASSSVNGSDLTMLPLFLGSQREQGTTSSLTVTMENVNNIFLRFEAEGYWWGARSVLPDGGPQRPPTGLYRA